MEKWLWQLKWALVIAIFAGPAIAFFGYRDGERIKHVLAQGTEITAYVDKIVELKQRRSSSYMLHAHWTDPSSSFDNWDFDITDGYAEKIMGGPLPGDDGGLSIDHASRIDHVTLKYLVSESPEDGVVVEDAANKRAEDQRSLEFEIIIAILGLITTPIAFWLERRSAKTQEDDIDATLAKMRGQAPKA